MNSPSLHHGLSFDVRDTEKLLADLRAIETRRGKRNREMPLRIPLARTSERAGKVCAPLFTDTACSASLRLLGQAEETQTMLPATSYEETLECMRLICRFPHFAPGESESRRTRDALTPLLRDFIQLTHVLALTEGQAVLGDVIAAIEDAEVIA